MFLLRLIWAVVHALVQLEDAGRRFTDDRILVLVPVRRVLVDPLEAHGLVSGHTVRRLSSYDGIIARNRVERVHCTT